MLTNLAKQLGIVIEGEFKISRLSDPNSAFRGRYYLNTDNTTRTVRWNERKPEAPGPWNGVDTTGFNPTLAHQIKQLESQRVRFYEANPDGEYQVRANLGDLVPIRRTALTREKAYEQVVIAVPQLWAGSLPPPR